MSEPHSFLVVAEAGERSMIVPLQTQLAAQQLAALLLGNPLLNGIVIHRVMSSNRIVRNPPLAAPEVTPGLPTA